MKHAAGLERDRAIAVECELVRPPSGIVWERGLTQRSIGSPSRDPHSTRHLARYPRLS
jgi:hypothetical protein